MTVRTLILTAVAALLLAVPAQAMLIAADPGGGASLTYVPFSTDFAKTTPPAQAAPRPDDRVGLLGPGPLAVGSPTTTSPHSSFHWTDAGIGAAAGGALILLLGVGAVTAARKHEGSSALISS